MEYRCSCLRYVEDETALAVGLSVGLVLLVIIIVVIIAIILCRRRQRKRKELAEPPQGELEMSTDQHIDDTQYSRQLSVDDDDLQQ